MKEEEECGEKSKKGIGVEVGGKRRGKGRWSGDGP